MKVFLSVSGEAFAPFVQHIYSLLKESGLTVVRYEGGTYSAKPMLDCDYVFMIPPFNPDAAFIVGKGQYEEFVHLSGAGKLHKSFMLTAANQKFVVEHPKDYTLLVRPLASVETIPNTKDWKKGFARIVTGDSHRLSDTIVRIKRESSSTLPKEWYVAVEGHESVISAWKKSKGKQSLTSSWKYVDEEGNGSAENDSNKPTITFEQFEEHVLGIKSKVEVQSWVSEAEKKVKQEWNNVPFGDPIHGEVEMFHDTAGILIAVMPNPNYKGLPFEEMKKLLILRR